MRRGPPQGMCLLHREDLKTVPLAQTGPCFYFPKAIAKGDRREDGVQGILLPKPSRLV
jgi:hypothetical protein